MQLDKLVQFHKTVGDITRIRILALLKSGPMNGQTLAERLTVSAPTITHHMTKLREADLIFERRDKNTIYFYLNEKSLKMQAEAIIHKVQSQANEEETMVQSQSELEQLKQEKERAAVLRNFFNRDGSLKHLPAQRKKKLYVLEHIVLALTPGKKYSEKEINSFILQYHPDFATIRREFIMNHYMYREQDVYELNPRELWLTT